MMPDEVSIALEAKSFSDATRDRPLVTRLYAEVPLEHRSDHAL